MNNTWLDGLLLLCLLLGVFFMETSFWSTWGYLLGWATGYLTRKVENNRVKKQ